MFKHKKAMLVGLAGVLSPVLMFSTAASAQAETVWATVYGSEYHGGTTANGERFNYYGSSTAASSIFPIGAVLWVSNRYGGRINDTCPACELDLPLGAAQQLGGYWNWSGTVKVKRLR